MTPSNFMDYAKSFGYGIEFTNSGLAYITLGDLKLTKDKELALIEKELALIGMSIMTDTMRNYPAELFHN